MPLSLPPPSASLPGLPGTGPSQPPVCSALHPGADPSHSRPAQAVLARTRGGPLAPGLPGSPLFFLQLEGTFRDVFHPVPLLWHVRLLYPLQWVSSRCGTHRSGVSLLWLWAFAHAASSARTVTFVFSCLFLPGSVPGLPQSVVHQSPSDCLWGPQLNCQLHEGWALVPWPVYSWP